MAMNSGQQDGMMSEINVTPLVDVMLVLLVVFIVTAPLMAPQSLKVSLPKTESVARDDKIQPVRLTIDAQGNLVLNEARLDEEALKQALQMRAADPQFQLQVDADETVPYGRVAQVMAIAQKAGVGKLSFTTVGK